MPRVMELFNDMMTSQPLDPVAFGRTQCVVLFLRVLLSSMQCVVDGPEPHASTCSPDFANGMSATVPQFVEGESIASGERSFAEAGGDNAAGECGTSVAEESGDSPCEVQAVEDEALAGDLKGLAKGFSGAHCSPCLMVLFFSYFWLPLTPNCTAGCVSHGLCGKN